MKIVGFNVDTKDEIVKFPNTVTGYYQYLFNKCFGKRFIEKFSSGVEKAVNEQFLIQFPELSKMKNRCVIGVIKEDTDMGDNLLTIASDISEIENKYFYKFLNDNDLPVSELNILDESRDGKPVLDKLKRITVDIYMHIIGQQFKVFKLNLEKQNLDPCSFLPIVIYSVNFLNVNYFVVLVNEDADPLYFDVSEETSNYIYEKVLKSNKPMKYNRKWTQNLDPSKDPVKTVKNANDSAPIRYALTLQSLARQEMKSKLLKEEEYSKLEPRSKSPRSLNLLFSAIKDITTEPELFAQPDIAALLACFNNPKSARAVAFEEACRILPQYYCFYYYSGQELKSFLSSVNIGVGKGWGGYAMRADSVREGEYLWRIEGKDENGIAGALSKIIGLESTCPTGDLPSGFYPTNWPADKEGEFNDQIKGLKLIEYFKKCKMVISAKSGMPLIPRVSHAEYPSRSPKRYDGKKDFKFDKKGLRIWKKGEVLNGELLVKNIRERLDAGAVMWKGFKKFEYFKSMRNLSATSFANRVLDADSTASTQWKRDNGGSLDVPDQEWCHLLGHGDGGMEQIGNFVSGSKHCNTEQLAIETGLRRITHNYKDFTDTEKSKITAKITAYLVPNKGTWVSGIEYSLTILKIFFSVNPLKNNLLSGFFQKVKGKSTYELTKPDKCSLAFEKLAKAISELKGKHDQLDKLQEALRFRQIVERNFFTYLPLARWIRYKIYYGAKKAFDHIYDAQSRSFDYNEAQILDYSVEKALYFVMNKEKEYFQKLEQRGAEFILTEKESQQINKLIAVVDEDAEIDRMDLEPEPDKAPAIKAKKEEISSELDEIDEADIERIPAASNAARTLKRKYGKNVKGGPEGVSADHPNEDPDEQARIKKRARKLSEVPKKSELFKALSALGTVKRIMKTRELLLREQQMNLNPFDPDDEESLSKMDWANVEEDEDGGDESKDDGNEGGDDEKMDESDEKGTG